MSKINVKKTKKKNKNTILAFIVIIVVGFFIFKCVGSLYDISLGIGKEFNVEKKTPLFTENTYSSINAGHIEHSSMKLLKVKDGWRYVQVENGKKYWIPPKEDKFDFDETVVLDVPVIGQFPELYNGCEAMATLMMLEYNEISFGKMEFADMIPKDNTELIEDDYDIIQWGDPKKGFVGDIKGSEEKGYSVDPEPILEMLEAEKIGIPIDLTGEKVKILENYIRLGKPVAVWISMGFEEEVEYTTWETKSGKKIKGTFNTHAMTLTGLDSEYYYLNDPYGETKNYQVGKQTFEKVWTKMGSKAITIL